jgi:hypothetical protein
VSCLGWGSTGTGIYQLSASVRDGTQPLPGANVVFTVIYPGTYAGTVTPPSALTNDAGNATAFLAVPDAAALPIVVEAVVGSSAVTTTVAASGGAICP